MAANRKLYQSSTALLANKASRARRRPVLHVCAALCPDDPARETVDLAIQTQRAGWPALIASSGGALVQESERAAVQHRLVALNRTRGIWNDWRARHRLDSVVQKDNPCLLHSHGFETLPYAYAVARSQRIPLVADILHPLEDRSATRRLLNHLDHIPCLIRVPTAFMAHHLNVTFAVPFERLCHIPSGIDLNWFSTAHVSPERLSTLSHMWRLPEQGTIACVALPFVSGMGQNLLLEALARLKQENIFVVLMGPDKGEKKFRAEIETMVDRLSLHGRVVMPEFCSDWPAALWHASVVVMPNEVPLGESRTVLAAQAMGRPMIITDIGSNRELVGEGTAWVVPPHNSEALAEALRAVVKLDINHRLALAESARDYIAASFGHQEWLNDMLTVYQTLLNMSVKHTRKKAKAA